MKQLISKSMKRVFEDIKALVRSTNECISVICRHCCDIRFIGYIIAMIYSVYTNVAIGNIMDKRNLSWIKVPAMVVNSYMVIYTTMIATRAIKFSDKETSE